MTRMRAMALAAVALAALAAAPAFAEQEWSKSYAVSGHVKVRVKVNDATVAVVTTPGAKQVEFRARYRDAKLGKSLTLDPQQSGDTVELDAHLQGNVGLVVSVRSLHLEVSMPEDADIEVDTGDGDVTCGTVRGRADLHSGDGKIALAGGAGSARLRSDDGDLEAGKFDGKAEAFTADGTIRLHGRFDALDAETKDGNVTVSAAPGSTIGSGWILKTADGDVELTVPRTFAADLEADALDGDINLELPVTVEGKQSSSRVRGKLGAGGPLLRVRSGDGSIRLRGS